MRGFHLLAGFLAILIHALFILPAQANEAMADAVLVLAIDASDSIDAGEFQTQIEGTADALTHSDVIAAIQSGPLRRVAISYVIWAESGAPKLIGEWHMVSDRETASRLASDLRFAKRSVSGTTGLGSGISASISHLRNSGVVSTRFIIDVSGDGRETRGVRGLNSMPLKNARNLATELGITINGLAIENSEAGLASWYRERVAAGPGNFVMKVGSMDEYGTAIRLKLIRELNSTPLMAARLPHSCGLAANDAG
ncbi:MAG: DUF1194 domain-containing protein [Aestuariivirga sp.]